MTDTVTLYHNPRCSKSRATLELLDRNGVQPAIVEYLRTPPTQETLEALLDMLGLEPRGLMRTQEQEYRDAGLDDPKLTRTQLIDAMARCPKLIERPIVVRDGKAVIGRPPEKVLELL
jgi:arsenate reductase